MLVHASGTSREKLGDQKKKEIKTNEMYVHEAVFKRTYQAKNKPNMSAVRASVVVTESTAGSWL